MSKVLVVGTGPLLDSGVKMIGGQCLRTWHFTQPILDEDHDVALYTIPIPDRSRPDRPGEAKAEPRTFRDFPYREFSTNDPARLIPALERIIERERPDALLGVNTLPAFMLASCRSRTPIWADLNGYHLIEGTMHAARSGTDEYLPQFWNQERVVVRRADKFSTVSERQRLALVGELAFCGRLHQFTHKYVFAHPIPNAVNEMLVKSAVQQGGEPEVRGTLVPEDAFIALWSGGYNSWTDVELLFTGLSQIMRVRDDVHFVSTGGPIEGFDEKTYEDFKRLIKDSPLRERFHLLGWVDAERLPRIYREADVGLNFDGPNYETLFGARNRLTNMMACGLCPCSTNGTEIAQELKANGLGLVFNGGSLEAFTQALLAATAGRANLRLMGSQARAFAMRRYSYTATTETMRNWMKEPALAPDNAERLKRQPGTERLSDVPLNEIERFMGRPLGTDIEQLQQDSADLAALREKKLYKIFKKLTGG